LQGHVFEKKSMRPKREERSWRELASTFAQRSGHSLTLVFDCNPHTRFESLPTQRQQILDRIAIIKVLFTLPISPSFLGALYDVEFFFPGFFSGFFPFFPQADGAAWGTRKGMQRECVGVGVRDSISSSLFDIPLSFSLLLQLNKKHP
jgi:hypothetical protein